MDLFSSKTYISFIKKQIEINSTVYGYKAKLADVMNTQRSYLSQLLQEKVHLTLEQAERLTRFWQMSPTESEFFLDLVARDKAGTEELKKFYNQRLQKIKDTQSDLSQRYEKKDMSHEHQAKYYSSWVYSAVHILLTIPEYNSVAKIAERLSLSPSEVHRVLNDLDKMALIKNEKNRWILHNNNVHLGSHSSFNSINHNNWRQKAVLDSIKPNTNDSLHYTAVYSVSREDYENIKTLLLSTLDQTRKIVAPSKEEELICFNCDLFLV